MINELAKICKVQPPSVYGWLDGSTKKLAGTNLIYASNYFNVSPFWLDSGKGKRELTKKIADMISEPVREVMEVSEGVSGRVRHYQRAAQ